MLIEAVVSSEYSRQYRLIRYITIEMLIVSAILIYLYSVANLWYLALVISAGAILAGLNLWLMIRTQNTKICGHFIVLIIFLIVLVANYFVRGLGQSFSLWFYGIPILAAALTNWTGLIIYSCLTLAIILASGMLNIEPFYQLNPSLIYIIKWINGIFAYLLIVTTLISLMLENERYESILKEKNVALQFEKDKYQYMARFDPLTNLPNRQYFKQHLQGMIDSLARDYCATIFFMDLDDFKQVNDNFGHDQGDYLLLQAACRLQLCFRKGDFVARLGGDEFTAVVLHPQTKNISQIIVQKIISAFEEPFIIANKKQKCTISVGFSTYPNDSIAISDLMHKADMAMYSAKRNKKYNKEL